MQRRPGARKRAVTRDEQEILQLAPIHHLQICRIVLQVYPLQSRRNWSVAAATSFGRLLPMRQIDHHIVGGAGEGRSEEHTSEIKYLMRISYAVFALKKKNT